MSNTNVVAETTKNVKHKPLIKFLKLRGRRFVRFFGNYGVNCDGNLNYFLTKKESKKIDKTSQNSIAPHEDDKKTKRKKRLLSLLYLGINIVVVALAVTVMVATSSEDPGEAAGAIFTVNGWYVLLALATFAGAMVLDQLRIAILMKKTTGRFRFKLSYKVSALGRYYDVLTPLSTGGQPFQVVYMTKYGINAGQGVSIAMGKYIFNQIIYFLCATFFLFSNLSLSNMTGFDAKGVVALKTAQTFGWIGYAICAIVIITIVFISFNKRAGTGLVVGVLKLLSKIKIGKFKVVKDYKASFRSVMKTVNVWQGTMKEYSKSVWVILGNLLTSLAYFLVFYSMPFFIYCAFGGEPSLNMLVEIITIAILVDLSSAFNPIPMGTGTADLSFGAMFGLLLINAGLASAKVWALLIWRALFYYIYIVQGLGIISYDYLIGNKRREKYKDYWNMTGKERLEYKKLHKK